MSLNHQVRPQASPRLERLTALLRQLRDVEARIAGGDRNPRLLAEQSQLERWIDGIIEDTVGRVDDDGREGGAS